MADFDAPSFSLGLDELDQADDTIAEEPSCSSGPCTPHFTSRNRHSSPCIPGFPNWASSSAQTPFFDLVDDFSFEDESVTPCPDLSVSNTPALKRLRRGRNAASSPEERRVIHEVRSGSDDEIEEFSPHKILSSENLQQNRSSFSTSKKLLWNKSSNDGAVKNIKTTSSSAPITISETWNEKRTFPRSRRNSSPLPTFQLPLNSDDSPSSSSSETSKDGINGGDFFSIPTPILNEVCEEYMRRPPPPPPPPTTAAAASTVPSHRYFFHEDPRIGALVRERLPHFVPLGTVDWMKNPTTTTIDYANQLQANATTEKKQKAISSSLVNSRTTKTSPMKRKKRSTVAKKKVKAPSSGFVDPRSSVAGLSVNPRNASKRRVHASSKTSSGRWYTAADGVKVYVTKNGEELTGRNAYMTHSKDSSLARRATKTSARGKPK